MVFFSTINHSHPQKKTDTFQPHPPLTQKMPGPPLKQIALTSETLTSKDSILRLYNFETDAGVTRGILARHVANYQPECPDTLRCDTVMAELAEHGMVVVNNDDGLINQICAKCWCLFVASSARNSLIVKAELSLPVVADIPRDAFREKTQLPVILSEGAIDDVRKTVRQTFPVAVLSSTIQLDGLVPAFARLDPAHDETVYETSVSFRLLSLGYDPTRHLGSGNNEGLFEKTSLLF